MLTDEEKLRGAIEFVVRWERAMFWARALLPGLFALAVTAYAMFALQGCAYPHTNHAKYARAKYLPLSVCISEEVALSNAWESVVDAVEIWNAELGAAYLTVDCLLEGEHVPVVEAFWNLQAGKVIVYFARAGDFKPSMRGLAVSHGGDESVQSLVWIKPGMDKVLEVAVLVHEFGHVLGLGHDSGWLGVGIMAPAIEDWYYIDNRTISEIKDIWAK